MHRKFTCSKQAIPRNTYLPNRKRVRQPLLRFEQRVSVFESTSGPACALIESTQARSLPDRQMKVIRTQERPSLRG
jgi:hypothetical protein